MADSMMITLLVVALGSLLLATVRIPKASLVPVRIRRRK